MRHSYARDDVDLGITASKRLSREARLALILIGLILTIGAWPLGFIFAVVAGGGHGSPFDGGATEFAMGVALLAVPFLVLLLGIACLACTNRVRLRIVGMLAAAVPATFVVAVALGHAASQPRDGGEFAMPGPPILDTPHQVIAEPGGKHVSIACNSVSGECLQREQQLGPEDTKSVNAIGTTE